MKRETGSLAVLVLTVLSLMTPQAVLATEEKPVSLEAIMEELSTLRSLVEAQQRQIEQLQAAVHPSVPPAMTLPANTNAYTQAQNPPQDELSKRVETLSTNLGGFKFTGDFRFARTSKRAQVMRWLARCRISEAAIAYG